jgi:pSer/pThr/pTyr-binding forkhead associated (FHA) protein
MSAAAQQKPQVQLKLSVVKGPHAGQVFQINKEKVVLGRGPENDVVLMNDPQVSRLHAEIRLVDREFEIFKISQKNAIIIDGESVDKWKLVSGSTFTIGDSEILIEFDLGQAVVFVQLIPKSSENTVVAVKPNAKTPSVPKAQMALAKPSAVKPAQPLVQQQARQMSSPNPQHMMRAQQQQTQAQARAPQSVNESIFDNPKFRFYAIAGFIIAGLLFFFLGPAKQTKSTKPKPTMKYEDEIAIKMNSTPEKELVKKREETKVDRNSPQYLRAQENFIRGMRDYNLGNYLRAQEFFQVVLNLDSDNQLAKRHLFLSQVRFDELVQTKLMLGESYYSKHNFSMCVSMYKQVVNMLDNKKADSKYKLAERKVKECELASQGIR